MVTYNYRRQYTIEHTPSLYSHHQYVNWQRILVVINYSLVIQQDGFVVYFFNDLAKTIRKLASLVFKLNETIKSLLLLGCGGMRFW
jgi:hypothetical protein